MEPKDARLQDGEQPDAAPAAEAAEDSPEVLKARLEELAQALEEARGRADGAQEDVLRARAEFDNMRKRAARDVEAAHKYALERFVSEMLPVRDSMELGIAAAAATEDIPALREGMDLTLKMFVTALERCGVTAVDPLGEKFNPDLHQAMSMEEAAGAESGTVLRVMQKGYVLNDRLVRPALVVVAK